MKPLLTLQDIADWAGVDSSRVPELVNAGNLPQPIRLSRKVDDWRWSEAAVERWADDYHDDDGAQAGPGVTVPAGGRPVGLPDAAPRRARLRDGRDTGRGASGQPGEVALPAGALILADPDARKRRSVPRKVADDDAAA